MTTPDPLRLPGFIEVIPPESYVQLVPVSGPTGPPGAPGDLSSAELQGIIDATLMVHVDEPEPHPAYDDMPTLRLIFENGLI